VFSSVYVELMVSTDYLAHDILQLD